MKTFADFDIDLKAGASGETKTTCPKCSSSRKKKRYPCLNVNVDEGVWNCWHCGWAGTLKGGEWQRPEIRKIYTRLAYAAPATGLPEEPATWFAGRGITPEILTRNRIGYGAIYMPQIEEEVNAVQFPYFRGESTVNIKYRDGRKNFRMAAGAERVLYGLNDIAETTIWVEGEMDKLSMEVAGFTNCVSVPDGAPAPDSKNYETKFDFLAAQELAKVKTHIIAVDNDAPGKRLEEELARRLGAENCLVVTWPESCKDANEVLLKRGAETLAQCIRDAKPIPVVGAFDVADLIGDLEQHYETGMPRGASTGWYALDRHYTVRPGEWTLITGIPGHGKSEFLDALTINLAAAHGWRFGIFSPENQPIALHLSKLAEKYTGRPFNEGPTQRMTKAEFHLAADWLDRRYTFILPESPSIDAILSVAQALVRRKGIRGLVIDPWNEIEHARTGNQSETEYISLVLSRVRQFARANGVHVWLVAHPAKLYKEASGKYPVPTPYDVSGSAHWRNKADNCIAVWRDQADDHARNVEIHVQKIRHKITGRIGMVTLSYDAVTGRYFDGTGTPAPLVRDIKAAAAADSEVTL
jgi:twinkle protein